MFSVKTNASLCWWWNSLVPECHTTPSKLLYFSVYWYLLWPEDRIEFTSDASLRDTWTYLHEKLWNKTMHNHHSSIKLRFHAFKYWSFGGVPLTLHPGMSHFWSSYNVCFLVLIIKLECNEIPDYHLEESPPEVPGCRLIWTHEQSNTDPNP